MATSKQTRIFGRHRPLVSFTVEPRIDEAIHELAKLRGMSRSGLIAYLVYEEARRERIDMEEMNKRWQSKHRGKPKQVYQASPKRKG